MNRTGVGNMKYISVLVFLMSKTRTTCRRNCNVVPGFINKSQCPNDNFSEKLRPIQLVKSTYGMSNVDNTAVSNDCRIWRRLFSVWSIHVGAVCGICSVEPGLVDICEDFTVSAFRPIGALITYEWSIAIWQPESIGR